MPALTITALQYAQTQAARTELDQMLLNGTTGGGTITAPFNGLASTPSAALDLYNVVQLAALRLFSVAQPLNNVAGALPLTGSAFTTRGGSLVLLVSGSAYPTAVSTQINLNIKIDGTLKGTISQLSNAIVHDRLAGPLLVTGIAAGSHTVTLEAGTTTVTDSGDFFSVVVIELPV